VYYLRKNKHKSRDINKDQMLKAAAKHLRLRSNPGGQHICLEAELKPKC